MRFAAVLVPLFLTLALPAWADDHDNDDSDDNLPSCAATCSVALSSAAIAGGANSNNYLNSACGDNGIMSAFSSCYIHAGCSDDDKDGASDWIHSTCRVVERAASTMTRSATTTTDSSSSTITTTFSSSSITSTTSSTTTTTSATATATPTATPQPHHGLSNGAKAGIAVGVILGVLLIAAGIIAYCVNRMRKSRLENQAAWPLNMGEPMGENDGAGLGAAAALAGGTSAAAMANRYGPRDPYNGLGPLPAQPELGNSGERHELHGQHFTPWNELATGVGQAGGAPRGNAGASGLPESLAIAGGSMAAANGVGGARFVSELDGTSITPAALARKPVNPFRSSQSGSSTGGGDGSVGAASRESQGELLSPISAADATDSDRRVSTVSAEDDDEPARVPLPVSPMSPASPTGGR